MSKLKYTGIVIAISILSFLIWNYQHRGIVIEDLQASVSQMKIQNQIDKENAEVEKAVEIEESVSKTEKKQVVKAIKKLEEVKKEVKKDETITSDDIYISVSY